MSVKYKDKLLKIVRKIEEEFDSNETTYGLLSEISKLLIPITDKLDGNDYYLWGLAHYSIASEPIENSKSKFIRAIQLDSDYYLARMYLAHCLHDEGKFYDAVEEYLKVDQDKLEEDFPIWRIATLNEQIGYCYFQLENYEKAMEFFEKVVNDYFKKHPAKEFIKPRDMIECLSESHALLEGIEIGEMS